MSPFDLFPPEFLIFFIATFAVTILFFVAIIYRILRPPQSQLASSTPQMKEREIIREIVKIRCSYCNNLYDEKYDKCPYCGGKKT